MTRSILLQIGGTARTRRRSGIHRVTVELARALPAVRPTDFVCWDAQAGGLRYADGEDLDALFGQGDWPEGVAVRASARQAGRSFRDELADPAGACFLDPEIPYHTPGGLEAFARSVTRLREYGVRSAALAYDLIPFKRPDYAADRQAHVAYMAELLRVDAVLAISRYTAEEFSAYWRDLGVDATPPVHVCLLPDGGFGGGSGGGFGGGGRGAGATAEGGPVLLMVGTVEPRKRQLAALEAFASVRRRSPAAAGARLLVMGSLHPAVADRFRQLVSATPGVEYLDYAPEWMLRSAFGQATATIFASEEEGFGLPIAESLARGVPCICADFGAMAEVAQGGGCLAVDVRDPRALEEAIVSICEDRGLRDRLRAEIAARRFRTWRDYAQDVAERLEAPLERPAAGSTLAVFGAAPDEIAALTAERFAAAAAADVLGFESASARDAFVDRAEAQGHGPLLTGRVVVAPQPALDRAAAAEAEAARRRRAFLETVRRGEAAYLQARSRRPAALPGAAFLRLVISTYNRRDFVVQNVRWILDSVLRAGDGVEFVVLDAGSTDGTLEALARIRHPRLKVLVAPTNTGMLGGWRDVAAMGGAEYVWVVGDDDFLVRQEFPAVLEAMRRHAGVPLGFVNFGVYARAAMGVADLPARLVAEQRPMTRDPAPSGLRRVAEIAGEHDNLFTAIYAIVWRADVLAAAYDHPFDGEPFVDLVESIPCTKLVLESFAHCQAYWHAPVAIAANAHNGWSRHRPRWHGLLMPQALALAREVGVEPERLQAWARTQHALFDTAMAAAREAGVRPRLSEEEAQLARVLFRRELDTSWPC